MNYNNGPDTYILAVHAGAVVDQYFNHVDVFPFGGQVDGHVTRLGLVFELLYRLSGQQFSAHRLIACFYSQQQWNLAILSIKRDDRNRALDCDPAFRSIRIFRKIPLPD